MYEYVRVIYEYIRVNTSTYESIRVHTTIVGVAREGGGMIGVQILEWVPLRWSHILKDHQDTN